MKVAVEISFVIPNCYNSSNVKTFPSVTIPSVVTTPRVLQLAVQLSLYRQTDPGRFHKVANAS